MYQQCCSILLTESLSKYLPIRILRSGNMQVINETKPNRTCGDRSFAIAAPTVE